MSVQRIWRWTSASAISVASAMRIVRPARALPPGATNQWESGRAAAHPQRLAVFGAPAAAHEGHGVSGSRDDCDPAADGAPGG
jgi:hypothetical protein